MDIKSRLAELGLSTRQLAEVGGVSYSTANAWIKQGHVPDPTRRQAAAELLQVDPEWLQKRMPENAVWLERQLAVRCISAAQLAEASGVPAHTIARYRRGEHDMQPETRYTLEQAMHVLSSRESGARRARIDAGLTILELAERLGVSGSEVYNVETHMQPVPASRAAEWAELLGCTVADLMEDAPDLEPAVPAGGGSGVHDGQYSQRDVPNGAWLGAYYGTAPVLRTARPRQMLVDGRRAGPARCMHVVALEAPWAMALGRHTVQLGSWSATWDAQDAQDVQDVQDAQQSAADDRCGGSRS